MDVVVTGIGTLTPFGDSFEKMFHSVISGASGVSKISNQKPPSSSVSIAGEIKNKMFGGWFSIEDYRLKKFEKLSTFISYSAIAANMAIEDSGIEFSHIDQNATKVGIVSGSGIGGIEGIEKAVLTIANRGFDRVSPFFVPSVLSNMPSGVIAMRHGIMGPSFSVISACATGSDAIGVAMKMIRNGELDIAVVCCAEASLCEVGFAGFVSMGALSTAFDDAPELASRPFDRDRDGFVMSEGAVALILERRDLANKRGAKIYGSIMGHASTNDAHHITNPHTNSKGAIMAMQRAIENAKINISDIDYINLHGTSTVVGDLAELNAIKLLYSNGGKIPPSSSTKSSTGHMLGVTGALEIVISLMTINKGIIPPTINLDNPIEESVGINLVPNIAQEAKIRYVMSNSFGFGGHNSCVVLGL